MRVSLLPPPTFVLEHLDLLILGFDLGLCNAHVLLGWLELGGDLTQLGLKLTSTPHVFVAVMAKRCVALPEDRNLVDLLGQLAVLLLGSGRLSSTFAFL